jgi:hypothetical protein
MHHFTINRCWHAVKFIRGNWIMKCMKLILLTCLCMTMSLLHAQPLVTSIDKTGISAGTLTVYGSNFGTGPSVKLFDRFESSSARVGDAIPLSSPDIGAWTLISNAPTYASQSYSGSYSAQTDDPKKFQLQFGQGVQEVFMAYWVRIPNGTNFPGASVRCFLGREFLEFSWLIDQDYQGDSSDVCLPTHVGKGTFYLSGNDFNLATGLGNSWWSWNSWVRVAVWLRANPSDPTANGNVLFQTVSQEKGTAENWMSKPVFDADGLTPKQYQMVNIPGWLRGGSTPLYDDIYIATGPNSIAHVEVTDSAIYSQSRNVAVQPANSWSSNSITVTVNPGSFANLDNAYLFVWDKDGNRNSTGFPLGTAVAPPMFPANIL